jgi:hypothetical protein
MDAVIARGDRQNVPAATPNGRSDKPFFEEVLTSHARLELTSPVAREFQQARSLWR